MPGRPQRVDDDALLTAIAQVDGPAATAREVADHVDIGPRAVLNRLQNLQDQDRVHSKQVGSRARIWWLSDDLDLDLDLTLDEDTDTDSEDSDLHDLVDAVDWNDVAIGFTDHRRDECVRLLRFLRDSGEARPKRLRELVDIDLSDSSVQRMISDVFRQIPTVERANGNQLYRWIDHDSTESTP